MDFDLKQQLAELDERELRRKHSREDPTSTIKGNTSLPNSIIEDKDKTVGFKVTFHFGLL